MDIPLNKWPRAVQPKRAAANGIHLNGSCGFEFRSLETEVQSADTRKEAYDFEHAAAPPKRTKVEHNPDCVKERAGPLSGPARWVSNVDRVGCVRPLFTLRYGKVFTALRSDQGSDG